MEHFHGRFNFNCRLLLMPFACTLLFTSQAADDNDRKVYVVYMGTSFEPDHSTAFKQHINMLQQVLTISDASKSLIYSYHRSFSGFAARLNDDEARKLAERDEVVSVFLSEKNHLQTTRSWDFMGFFKGAPRTRLETDLIIGMLDTGIWPESESFSDEGFGPPPEKWKGQCQSSSNFTCNNKIIGARFFRSEAIINGEHDILSPRDTEGHGTLTSSTAAGNLVTGASLFGLGLGTSRGGSPSARIAVYKICWSEGCFDADILAAFDHAIADGVDIISLSVAGSYLKNYFEDSIAIGAFHAMKNGILTSNAGGNSDPLFGSIKNASPWSLSVAASTIDRKFVANVKLGNGDSFLGISVNTFQLGDKLFPLIYAGDAPNSTAGFNGSSSRFCFTGSLDANLVQGKIVLCDGIADGEEVSSGAVGMIMQDDSVQEAALLFPLPASQLDLNAGNNVFQYLRSTSNPVASIEKSTVTKDLLAPYVVSFSSRGPNLLTPDILKPDLAAPGVDILASWSEGSAITSFTGDNRKAPFNIVSGTSIACPHATGAAAYVKSFHPTWSPAAIKSALMTTALPMTPKVNTEAEFAYGAGHLNPVNATNPGLVYDAQDIDYIEFLCGQGYSTENLRLVTGDQINCSDVRKTAASHLNYPSFALLIKSQRLATCIYPRTVTNVGLSVSTYKAVIQAPSGLKVRVYPATLSFSSLGQKISFTVRVEVKSDEKMLSGSLTWDDGLHLVRSPIVAYHMPSWAF